MSGLHGCVPGMGEIERADALVVVELLVQVVEVVQDRWLLEVAGLERYLHRMATGSETMLSGMKAGASKV